MYFEFTRLSDCRCECEGMMQRNHLINRFAELRKLFSAQLHQMHSTALTSLVYSFKGQKTEHKSISILRHWRVVAVFGFGVLFFCSNSSAVYVCDVCERAVVVGIKNISLVACITRNSLFRVYFISNAAYNCKCRRVCIWWKQTRIALINLWSMRCTNECAEWGCSWGSLQQQKTLPLSLSLFIILCVIESDMNHFELGVTTLMSSQISNESCKSCRTYLFA